MIAARITVGSYDAVAGNDERDRIGRARAGDGACGIGLTDSLRDFLVGARAAAGDALQLAPDAPLKGGGPHIRRKSRIGGGRRETLDDLLHPSGQPSVAARDCCLRIFGAEIALERPVGIAEFDGANTPRGRGDQQPAKG